MVIQNYPACNSVCETHAWHLHGMHFWVLGTGRGMWSGSAEQLASLNKHDPVKRDVTQTIGEGVDNKPWVSPVDYAPCGWTMIRFRVETPGAWYFHCHQLWHIVMGSNAIFYTPAAGIPEPPPNLLLCGEMTAQVVVDKLTPPKTTEYANYTVGGTSRRSLAVAASALVVAASALPGV